MGERSPPFPERVGRYDVLLPIASGGMGTVYLARATSIGGFEREVALKLIHSHLKDNASFASDLVEEAKLTVRVRHPNVVSVIDVGEDPFGIYLVMEYVEGDTLAGIHKRALASPERQLPVRIGLKLLLDALTGLHAAHELKDAAGNPTGLVHRDFSPQNILVGVDGIGRLTDFGIAKAATRISDTTTGTIKGKIAYMAPEQARGAQIDRRTDIWAAGVVAWQILTGLRLYAGQENEVATLLKIATEPPPRIRDVRPDVAPVFDEAVARALTMDAEQRWPTALAFKQALLEACRAQHEVADTDEVAAFVTRVVDPVVAERRRRVDEILRLRAEVVKIAARTDASEPVMTPSQNVAAVASTSPITDEPETLVLAEPKTLAITEAKTLTAPAPVPRIEITRTDTTSVTEPRVVVPPPDPPSRWTPILYAAGGVLAASIIFLAVAVALRGPATSSNAIQTLPVSASVTAAVTVTTGTAATATKTDTQIPVVTTPPAPSASTSAAFHPPATTSPHVAKPTPKATATQSPLPKSPYEGQ